MRTSYNAKTLFVDLSDKRVWVETLPDFYPSEYLGGRGAAARLLWDMTNAKTKPFGKNSVLIFSPGSLTGTSAPTSGRTTVTFKSPATGGYFKSSVGGSIGFALKNSGYDHVVIRGKAKSPVYLYVAVDRIEIRDAQHVWGANVIETNRQIKSEMENDELRIACIGVAGEKLCNFASILCTYYTAAARGGGGAVMGSKNLKALVVNPAGGKIYVSNPKQFTEAVQRAREASLADSHAMEMKLWGTSTSTDQMALAGLLPTYNYKRQWLKGGHGNLTGRHLQEEGYLKRSVGCSSCLFGCHRFTEINQGPYKGTYSQGPEYETFASLGGNLGITDSRVILKANAIANERGFDVISLGSVVGWAIESYENGLLSKEDTGGKELRWEDGETLFFLIDAISKREGIGDLLADGVRIASKKIGGGSYKWAIQARGLEQSRVELRGAFSYALAFSLNPRGPDHLTTEALAEFGTGYTVEAPRIIKKITGSEDYAQPYLLEKRAEIVTWHENIYAVSDSLGYCAFATTACYGVDEKVLSDTFNSATGLTLSPRQIMEAGRRIVTLERCYNLREGWSRACDTLPWRIMNEKAVDLDERQPVDAVISHEMLDKMLDDYYAINNWDPQNGFPAEETLKALSLEFTIPELREKRGTAMDYLPESCREE